MKLKIVCCSICLASALGLVWYNHQYHCYGYPFATTSSGLTYKAVGQGNGRKVKDNEWVKVSLVIEAVPKEVGKDTKQPSEKNAGKTEKDSAKELANETKQPSEENIGKAEKDSAKALANETKQPSEKNVGKAEKDSAKALGKKTKQPSEENVEKAEKDSGKKVKKSSPKKRILINQSEPFFLPFNQYFQSKSKSIAEMIHMVQEKQAMIFKCRPEYFFKEKSPKDFEHILALFGLNKEDELLINIKLYEIMTDAEYKEMLEKSRATQLAKDKELIRNYLAKYHIEASSTHSGLSYIIDQSSDGTPVAKGNAVKVNYTGRLLDGTIFDTNLEEVAKANNLYNPQRLYKPFDFPVGVGRVIQGWDEAFLLLKKGEKARFFIPSALAYGQDGRPPSIPKNAILLFEVEVVDISDRDLSQSDHPRSNKSKSN